MPHSHIAIVGGGIVGLATAYQLTLRFPRLKVHVLEKESAVGTHQTGRNSGVLHSGIYYKPGSLKAINCREGRKAMVAFCQEHGVPHDVCGKVIVATRDDELPRLHAIYERGQQNGIRCEWISPAQLKELEPFAVTSQAVHVPETGIVNYRTVAEKLADLVRQRDGTITCGVQVTAFRQEERLITLETTGGEATTEFVVACGGLHSDRLAKAAGVETNSLIVPFRGEYYDLKPAVSHYCRNLIYPVPDPAFPFLGVHFTRMIDGGVECGPNAVLAFAREGYRKLDLNWRDLAESLTYAGFLRLAAKHWAHGFGEMWRSFSKRAFVLALQRLMPLIQESDLVPGRAGVRAQAIAADGAMVDDFVIQSRSRMVHVLNAPSPAATSSLNIGKLIVAKMAERLENR